MKRIDFSRIWRCLKSKIPFLCRERSDYLMHVTKLSVNAFEKRMIAYGFQYNYFSYTERGQVSNMRKLYIAGMDDSVIRQIHVRLFDDGYVHAHDELAYEYDALGHTNGLTLREVDYVEKMLITDLLME